MTDALVDAIKSAILPDFIQAVTKVLHEQSQKELLEKYITFDQALDIVPVTRGTLYNWMDKDLIKSYQIGGRRFFKYSEFIQAITKIKKYSKAQVAG